LIAMLDLACHKNILKITQIILYLGAICAYTYHIKTINNKGRNEMNINGKQYIVLGEKKIGHASGERKEISLKLPRGKKIYYVVVYANGTMSEVV